MDARAERISSRVGSCHMILQAGRPLVLQKVSVRWSLSCWGMEGNRATALLEELWHCACCLDPPLPAMVDVGVSCCCLLELVGACWSLLFSCCLNSVVCGLDSPLSLVEAWCSAERSCPRATTTSWLPGLVVAMLMLGDCWHKSAWTCTCSSKFWREKTAGCVLFRKPLNFLSLALSDNFFEIVVVDLAS